MNYYLADVKTFHQEVLVLMKSVFVKHKREQRREGKRGIHQAYRHDYDQEVGAVARYERFPDFRYLLCSGTGAYLLYPC